MASRNCILSLYRSMGKQRVDISYINNDKLINKDITDVLHVAGSRKQLWGLTNRLMRQKSVSGSLSINKCDL